LISQAKRLVIKVGGSLLLKDNEPNTCFIENLAGSVAKLLEEGRKVVIVSSGAIALGKKELGSLAFWNFTLNFSKNTIYRWAKFY